MKIFDSIRFRFTSGVFLLIIAITALLSILSYKYEEQAIEKRVYAQLNATADLKKELVVNYINERMNDLRALAAAADLRESIESSVHRKAWPSKTGYYTHSYQHLGSFKATYPDYLSIEVTDLKGDVIISSEGDHPPVGHAHSHRKGIDQFIDTLKRGGAVITQDYLDEKERHLDFAVGVRDKEGDIHAVIISSIGLKNMLFPLFSDYTGLGYTGETLLLKQKGDDIIFINETRHPRSKGMAGAEYHTKNTLGRAAASGNEGIDESVDYRGKKIIAAYRYIPALRWGVIVKVDTEEAFEEIMRLRKRILILSLFILALMLPVVYVIMTKFINPIVSMTQKTGAVASGDYSIRVGSHRRDEIGSLQNNFDAMVEALRTSRKEIAKKQLELEDMNAALERKVAERTAELSDANVALTKAAVQVQERVEELEKFYEMAIDREIRMKEMKKEMERLRAELSKHKKDADGR